MGRGPTQSIRIWLNISENAGIGCNGATGMVWFGIPSGVAWGGGGRSAPGGTSQGGRQKEGKKERGKKRKKRKKRKKKKRRKREKRRKKEEKKEKRKKEKKNKNKIKKLTKNVYAIQTLVFKVVI